MQHRILLTLSVVTALTARVPAAGPDVSFWGQREFAILSPSAVATGDFNGDTRPDVVVTNFYAASATVLLNGGGVRVAPVGPSPSCLATGDFNGDSRLDVVVGGSDGVAVLLGAGDGTFESALFFSSGNPARWIGVADFNRDARLDVIVHTAVGGAGSVLLGNGDGTLRPAAPLGLSSVLALAVGDFNGDGEADIAASDFGWRIALLPGKGDGTFLPPIFSPTGQLNPYSAMAAGDFNGDGRDDLVVSLTGKNYFHTVRMLIANSDGTFQPVDAIAIGGPGASFATGDFNHDSNLDVAVVTDLDRPWGEYPGSLSVLLGNGDGELRIIDSYVAGADAVAVADLNGDENADVVTVAGGSEAVGTVSVRFGTGEGKFPRTGGLQMGSAVDAIAVDDFNGDGSVDLVAAVTEYIAVILGNGDGTFRSSPAVLPAPFIVQDMAAGDFNGDSRPDLVAAGRSPDGIYVLIGQGDGSLAPAQLIGPAIDAAHVVVKDLTGDGVTDVVAWSPLVVLIGNGNGTFQAPIATGLDPLDVAVDDIDGDSVLDLALVSSHSKTVSVAFGVGDGTFRPSVDIALSLQPRVVALGDFNMDGRMDAAVWGHAAPSVNILLGMGNGIFQPPVGYYAVHTIRGGGLGDEHDALYVADFNGDDQPDLAVHNVNTLWILLGNGDGTLRLQPIGFFTVASGHSMRIADFTSDGLLDVAIDGVASIALLYNKTPADAGRRRPR